MPAIFRWPNNGAVRRRIQSSLRDQEDLYFSVAKFRSAARDATKVQASLRWLWADLDEVTPDLCGDLDLEPTICWRSSPGKYQALWRLEQGVSPAVHERLNRMLSYALGADKGGWDLTQVLRIPGTQNFKYEGAPRVKIVEVNPGFEYNGKQLFKQLTELGAGQLGAPDLPEGRSSTDKAETRPLDSDSIEGLPARAKRLLKTPAERVVVGERSARLWELECILAEFGLDQEGIYLLVKDTAWNKWKELRTGEARLRREIAKATAHVAARVSQQQRQLPQETSEGLPRSEAGKAAQEQDSSSEPIAVFENYADFMAKDIRPPTWLVEEVWTAASHGIIGGEPKTSKSTIALGLALSVASGRPFLDQFRVGNSGPVLVIQEENAPWMMQDRLRKMASYYGLIKKDQVHVSRAGRSAVGAKQVRLDFPDDVPLGILNNFGFDMTLEEHRDFLEQAVDQIRPVLLVLDPLYLMLGGADVGSEQHLRPFLKWLLYLRYTYNVAIVLVHHFRKASITTSGNTGGAPIRAGQRLLGSTTLHAWIESALYCEAMDTPLVLAEDEADVGGKGSATLRIRMEREFRNVGPRVPWDIGLTMGEPGSLEFSAAVHGFDLSGEVIAVVTEAGENGITRAALAEALGVDARTALQRARGAGLKVTGGKRGRGHEWRIKAR